MGNNVVSRQENYVNEFEQNKTTMCNQNGSCWLLTDNLIQFWTQLTWAEQQPRDETEQKFELKDELLRIKVNKKEYIYLGIK